MSYDARLKTIETVLIGRFGEFAAPEYDATGSAVTSPPADFTELSETVYGLVKDMSKLTDAMDKLVAETTAMGSVVDAIVTQQAEFTALLRENAVNPDQINAIADTIDAYSNRLASAVAVNTPATTPDAVETPPIADPIAEPTTPEEEAASSNSPTVSVPEPTA